MTVDLAARRAIARRGRQLVAQTRELIRRTRHSIDDSVERIAIGADRTGVDEALVRVSAARIAAHKGKHAIGWLLRREAEAVGRGDRLSAEAWADLATAAETLGTDRRHGTFSLG